MPHQYLDKGEGDQYFKKPWWEEALKETDN